MKGGLVTQPAFFLSVFSGMISKKEQFLQKDRLIKGITSDGFFKLSVVKTTEAVQLASQKHGLSPLAAVILGRALTGTILLAGELKGEERIRVDLQGNGPLEHVITEANAVGEMRGYVANPLADLDYETASGIGDGLGLGVLTFTKTLYNEAHPTTGTVELVKGNVSEDIAYYLFQSEQIPSAITLDVQLDESGNILAAGGILVQALPGAPEDAIDALQANITALMPIGERLLAGDYIDTLMDAVAGSLGAKELDRNPVHYFCRCTKDRFVTALSMLDLNELTAMSETTQELVCHYCNNVYKIEPVEIKGLIREKKIKMN